MDAQLAVVLGVEHRGGIPRCFAEDPLGRREAVDIQHAVLDLRRRRQHVGHGLHPDEGLLCHDPRQDHLHDASMPFSTTQLVGRLDANVADLHPSLNQVLLEHATVVQAAVAGDGERASGPADPAVAEGRPAGTRGWHPVRRADQHVDVERGAQVNRAENVVRLLRRVLDLVDVDADVVVEHEGARHLDRAGLLGLLVLAADRAAERIACANCTRICAPSSQEPLHGVPARVAELLVEPPQSGADLHGVVHPLLLALPLAVRDTLVGDGLKDLVCVAWLGHLPLRRRLVVGVLIRLVDGTVVGLLLRVELLVHFRGEGRPRARLLELCHGALDDGLAESLRPPGSLLGARPAGVGALQRLVVVRAVAGLGERLLQARAGRAERRGLLVGKARVDVARAVHALVAPHQLEGRPRRRNQLLQRSQLLAPPGLRLPGVLQQHLAPCANAASTEADDPLQHGPVGVALLVDPVCCLTASGQRQALEAAPRCAREGNRQQPRVVIGHLLLDDALRRAGSEVEAVAQEVSGLADREGSQRPGRGRHDHRAGEDLEQKGPASLREPGLARQRALDGPLLLVDADLARLKGFLLLDAHEGGLLLNR